eukprot:4776586-Amphidinium_carterae.1
MFAVEALIKAMLTMNPAHRPTLQEILHLAFLRRKLPSAFQTVLNATHPEALAASCVVTQKSMLCPVSEELPSIAMAASDCLPPHFGMVYLRETSCARHAVLYPYEYHAWEVRPMEQ